jgi:ADP-ribose pyrophosphatase
MTEYERLIEKTLHSEQCFNGSFLDVHRDICLQSNGNQVTREYIKHPGAAVIVALLGDEASGYRIVLERQYRHPVKMVMIEVPAGKREVDEPCRLTARRELREETGYTAKQWAYAGVIHPCIGYADECMELWFARDLQSGKQQLDDEELLTVFSLPVSEFIEYCLSGKISDAKTLSAAFWLQNFLAQTIVLTWHTT